MRPYKHLTLDERIRIETLLNIGKKPVEIAAYLNRSVSTIYLEIKRGKYIKRNYDWTESEKYSYNKGQQAADEAKKNQGVDLKIGNNHKALQFIETLIRDKKYSPYAASVELKKHPEYGITLCKNTIYNYIRKGIFLNLTMKDLPQAPKRGYHKVVRRRKKDCPGKSIEARPAEVLKRKEFGHWEMDSVMGKQGVSKKALVVLTERKTRKELVFIAKDHTAESVVKILDKIERKIGERTFRQVFRSITVDNGCEFADYKGMTRSRRNKRLKRTEVYYCHPYCSSERGSNENENKLIRRFIPKGSVFDDKTQADISRLKNWINTLPRFIFCGRSADDVFRQECTAVAVDPGLF